MSTAKEDLRFLFLYKTLLNRFIIFKSQDLENGHFDVVFEIEGKKLYGHKFVLTSVSTTLDSWLSDRWSTKDEIIKIESYSFDSFYLFLCFVYSGSCELTAENVREIVDISEFFAVPCLKEFCDEFLSKMENFITLENAEEMFDFSQKYSLPRFLGAIKKFTSHHAITVRQFVTSKKGFVQFLLTDKNLIDIYVPLFERVYHWAENQIVNSEGADQENFNLLEAIKAKVYEVLPNRFSTCHMYFEFLRDFYLEKGFALSPTQFYEFYRKDPYSYKREKRLRWVYQLAKKQAQQKRKISSDPESFSVTESIKADLAVVLSRIKFYRIKKSVVMDLLVANGIFSEEEANGFYNTHVEFVNDDKIITGDFLDEYGIRKKFESYAPHWANDNRQRGTNKCRFFNVKIPIPSTPSTLTKMKGVEWYLCLEKDGVLTVKEHNLIERSDYLLAEMETDDDSPLKPKHYTCLTFSDNI